MAYLLYQLLVDGAKYKSHLGKNCSVISGLMVSLGLTKHRLLINHFQLQTSLLSDNFLIK